MQFVAPSLSNPAALTTGDYHRGRRHGYGVYSFPNNDQYLGEYEKDIPHGYGVYVFASGQKYEGEWEEGRKHGWCEYTVETGNTDREAV